MKAVELIKQHEGLRLRPYKDTTGKLTIGYGRNLDDNGISTEEAEMLLKHDIHNAQIDLNYIFSFETLSEIDDERFGVLVNMMFNLGLPRLKLFRKMIAAVERKDYEDAADEMLDSLWATQVGNRAMELAEIMRNGY